jgi:hypothetical protein
MKIGKQLVSSLIAVALLGAFGSVGASPARVDTTQTTKTTKTTTVTKIKVPVVTKAGWWIRVDTQKTVASSIRLQAGMTRADRHDWRTWTAGEPEEFDLPVELRNLPKLHIRGITDPKGKKVSFCVFFQNHGVEHFEFDGDKDDNMRSTHKEDDCKP